MAVVVITPCTGTPELERCIRSVARQSVPCMHLIVADGSQCHKAVCTVVSKLRAQGVLVHDNHRLIQLPYNTGANGMNGHRIYAAMPWLLECDWVALLDEDNFYDSDHIEGLLDAAREQGTQWAHSLRKVCADSGQVLVEDKCESLGLLHQCWDRGEHFCDTSTLLMRRQLACALSPLWDCPVVADRRVSAELVRCHKGATSARHSLNYTIGSGHSSAVTEAFFRNGNAAIGRSWDGPARGVHPRPLYVFHFGPAQTRRLFECLQGRQTGVCRALEQWQVTQFDALADRFLLLDGFEHEATIPPGAHVFVNWVHPHLHLPWATLRRGDVHKHTWLVESPNIRHTCQWDDELFHHFSTVFTFWRPMLTPGLPMCRFGRMNCHWLDLRNPAHHRELVENCVDDRSVGMVLANRDLAGQFVVRNTLLTCQDPLRRHFVRDLRNAVVYGLGWEAAQLGPGVRVGGTDGPDADTSSSVALLSRHTFGLVIENVDADGYVSEKLYDCLVAGCIPIYLGGNNELVGIPQDMYIDLRQFSCSAELQHFLDAVDVPAFKRRVHEGREEVLRRVSAEYFAEQLGGAIEQHSA